MKNSTAVVVLSAVLTAVAANAQVSQSSAAQTAPESQTPGSQAPGIQTPVVPNQNPNPDASNPGMPLPGTANPGSSAAPMVPNPMPAPGVIVAPAAGGDQRAVTQAEPVKTDRREAAQDKRKEKEELRAIRASVMRPPTATPTGMKLTEAVRDLKVVRKNGKVVLTGTVATQAEKDAAGSRASQAADGREIVNEITVREAKK